jgi:hypothetical protein
MGGHWDRGRDDRSRHRTGSCTVSLAEEWRLVFKILLFFLDTSQHGIRFSCTIQKCYPVRFRRVLGGEFMFLTICWGSIDSSHQSFFPTLLVLPLALMWNAADWTLHWFQVSSPACWYSSLMFTTHLALRHVIQRQRSSF